MAVKGAKLAPGWLCSAEPVFRQARGIALPFRSAEPASGRCQCGHAQERLPGGLGSGCCIARDGRELLLQIVHVRIGVLPGVREPHGVRLARVLPCADW